MLQYDYSKFIGVPWAWREESFQGCDCWTFCCLIWKEVFHKTPPKLEYAANWEETFLTLFPKYFEKVEDFKVGDLCIMTIRKPHFGVLCEPNLLLQCAYKIGGFQSTLERFSKFIKIIGRPRF